LRLVFGLGPLSAYLRQSIRSAYLGKHCKGFTHRPRDRPDSVPGRARFRTWVRASCPSSKQVRRWTNGGRCAALLASPGQLSAPPLSPPAGPPSRAGDAAVSAGSPDPRTGAWL